MVAAGAVVILAGLAVGLVEVYRFPKGSIWVVVGVTFSLAHGLLQAFPELAIFGCALAWLRWQTRSVYPGMILHGTFNAISLVAAVTVR